MYKCIYIYTYIHIIHTRTYTDTHPNFFLSPTVIPPTLTHTVTHILTHTQTHLLSLSLNIQKTNKSLKGMINKHNIVTENKDLINTSAEVKTTFTSFFKSMFKKKL